MLKKIVFSFFIFSSIIYSDISQNIGIQNNYIHDKIHFKNYNYDPYTNYHNTRFRENFNLYDLAFTYGLAFDDSVFFDTKLDLGEGSPILEFFSHTKEKILNFGFNLAYLFRIGPLSYGPKIGFDYNLQKIKEKGSNFFTFLFLDAPFPRYKNKTSIEWYFPNIGLVLKLQPIASYPWHLYAYYDFGLGKVKLTSKAILCDKNYHPSTLPSLNYDFDHQALRNKFSIGSYQKLFKNIYCDLFFIYSREKKEHKNTYISRESFEGGISLNCEF